MPHCHQDNRLRCGESISHHSFRYVCAAETQSSTTRLVFVRQPWMDPGARCFHAASWEFRRATCERICLTSGPVLRKWTCWKCVFVCWLGVRVEGFKKQRLLEISQEIIHHRGAADRQGLCFIRAHGGIINRQEREQASVVWAVTWTPAVFSDTFAVRFS